MYYTVIKQNRHLRTWGKCRKHELQASVFYISRVFSNVQSVLSQCITWLRLLNLLYDIEVMWQKTIAHAFPIFYTLIKHGFLTIRARRFLSILQKKWWFKLQKCFGGNSNLSHCILSHSSVDKHCSTNTKAMNLNPVGALKIFFLFFVRIQLCWSHLHFNFISVDFILDVFLVIYLFYFILLPKF